MKDYYVILDVSNPESPAMASSEPYSDLEHMQFLCQHWNEIFPEELYRVAKLTWLD